MKKNLKMLAVLSAAAVMTAAAPEMGLISGSSTAYAKTTGWVEENGSYKYYDEDDYFLTDTWKKRGDDWYYLNEEGETATSTQVDEYYVDETGKRVTDKWISIENEDAWDSPDAAGYHWYYYGKNGKAAVSKWQKIGDSWYYFNDDAQMMTGMAEIDGATYYLGDENSGAMKTGWIQLENESDDPEMTQSWHYFDSNGKMVENHVDKKINGEYYTFVDGVMQTGWFKLPAEEQTEKATSSDADKNTEKTVAGYQYYEPENGKRADGWKTIEGVEGISEEGELYSFYFKNGKPCYAETGLRLFNVESKKYAFNTKGEMQTGLKVVNLEDGSIANFYFADDGIMRTGKQVIYNDDLGENQTWFFYTDGSGKGQGFHGIRDNTLYEYGLRKDADADLRLAPMSYDGNEYLVNTSGSIQKASSSSKSAANPELGKGFKDYKDANGKVWVVNTDGIIQQDL